MPRSSSSPRLDWNPRGFFFRAGLREPSNEKEGAHQSLREWKIKLEDCSWAIDSSLSERSPGSREASNRWPVRDWLFPIPIFFFFSSFTHHKGYASNFLSLNEILCRIPSHETVENGAVLAGAKNKQTNKQKPVTQLPASESLYRPLGARGSLIIITWERVIARLSRSHLRPLELEFKF